MQLKDKDNTNVMPNTSADQVSYGNTNVAAALAALEQGGGGGSSALPLAGKRICFFGDSITDPFADTGGYPDLVISKVGAIPPKMGLAERISTPVESLPADLFDGTSAIYGISGAHASDVRAMVLGTTVFSNPNSWPKHVKVGFEGAKDFTQYDAVVIMIGTNSNQNAWENTSTHELYDMDACIPDICVNDISSYPYTYSAPGKYTSSATLQNADEFFTKLFSYARYYDAVAASIEYIRWKNPNCRIFLVTIPPNDSYIDSNEVRYFTKIRERIISLAEKLSVQVIDAQVHAGCCLWNIGYWIGNDQFGSGHHIHPNAIGKELWASYIANELNKQWYSSNVTTT